MTDRGAIAGSIDLIIGEWTMQPSLNRLDRNGESVDLEPKLMDLLGCLVEHAGEVVSKEDLLDRVWRVEHVSDGTLSHAVAELRRALGDDARHPKYIETIRKRGYRLVADVTPVRRTAPLCEANRTASRRSVRTVVTIALLAVLAAVAWLVAGRSGNESSPPPKIVILPFESLGGDPNDNFAAGLTDEIISRLAAVRGLQVVSRTTAFNYNSTGKSVRDIGRDLKVEYILEGAVRWSTDTDPPTVRITPQLISVDADGHLWSGQFDRHPESLLDVQSEIAQQIVAHLDLRLARQESDIVDTPPTDNPTSYRAFLGALEHRGSLDGGDLLTAAEMYRRAVDLDPGFAQAWAGLAEVSSAIHHHGHDRGPGRCDTARLALARARHLAPDSPDTMRASAYFLYYCEGDAAAARFAFEMTLESWPGDAQAMTGLAFTCRRTGRWGNAEKWFQRALENDPRNPFILWNLGQTLVFMHRYEEGLTLVNRAVELAPDLRYPYMVTCLALWRGWGDTHRAAEVLERSPGPRDAAWYAYAFRSACYIGDFDAAWRLAQDSPAGQLSQLQLCLAAELADNPKASMICSEAAAQYRADRDREPGSLWPHIALALVCSLSGRHAEAEAEAAAAVAMTSFETDALGHTEALTTQAQILGRAGRTEEAVALVERLLSIPSGVSPATLRIDPEWASLRHHPRVEAIIRTDPPPITDRIADGDRN